jgi:hypothetical protein
MRGEIRIAYGLAPVVRARFEERFTSKRMAEDYVRH